MSEPIPSPPGLPLIGNLLEIDPTNSMMSFSRLAETYGKIFRLNILGRSIVFISGGKLCDELSDDKRFEKGIGPPLIQVRNGVGAGLFTAFNEEEDWHAAHRTLIPAFGPLPIQNMWDEMHDISSQLILKWSRFGPERKINVADDFTRLTLDSIALCAMDTRFNSFYHDDMHPFVKAMTDFLLESGKRANRPAVQQYFMSEATRKYESDIKVMKSVAQEVLDRRRKNPSNKKDLLNAMVIGKDPKTGLRLSDENIMNNMITFLIAGHETTSGMLSFTTYYILKSPTAYRKIQEEVDRVVGKGPVQYKHVAELEYVQACLREALRLQPTATAFGRKAKSKDVEIIGGGKYKIEKDEACVVFLPGVHRDSEIWGEDSKDFKPERMYGDNFKNLPPNVWKPFGTGARGCIGRPFAWQEAIMAMAMVFQNFDLRLADPSYTLSIKQTLTIKPDGLEIYATQRGAENPGEIEKRLFGAATSKRPTDFAGAAHHADHSNQNQAAKPLTILYGGNSGTCEGLAQSLAGRAEGRGFQADVASLDSAAGKLPKNQPIIILTASFEGQPADNAAQFFEWLNTAPKDAISSIPYAVFGCGHHDWASTYQRIPRLMDELLAEKGGKRLVERGETDVALGQVFDDFDAWVDEKLWTSLGLGDSAGSNSDIEALDVQITSSARVSALKQSVLEALVEKAEVLSGPGVSEKRLITFRLPSTMSYESGDYLNVLPLNPSAIVSRALKRFGLAWDAEMVINSSSHTSLPTNSKQSISLVLSAYVELGLPASKKAILALAQLSDNDAVKKQLEDVASGSENKASILDILEQHPTLPCPFGLFLSLLPSMRIRQYSISSSPLIDPTLVSITYHVLDVPSHSVTGRRHLGVTTNYLKTLQPGQKALVQVKKSHYSFHLPADPERHVIMVCAGTGIAPFRAFVEERAAKIKAGQKLGRALLFVGCSNEESDVLYRDELKEWVKVGAVETFYAFSKQPEKSKGAKYAQERMYVEKDALFEVFMQGAKVFVCGASRMGNGVQDVCIKLHREKVKEHKGKEVSLEEGKEWFDSLKVQERWSSDIFG